MSEWKKMSFDPQTGEPLTDGREIWINVLTGELKSAAQPEAPQSDTRTGQPLQGGEQPEAPQFDIHTGQPLQGGEQPEAPRFDTRTGQPLQGGEQPEAPRFDTRTGQPLQGGAQPEAPRFDIYTGQPLQGGAQPEAPRFDIYTGQPLQGGAQSEAPRFDTRTGEPLWQDASSGSYGTVPERRKKWPVVLTVLLIAVAVVAIVAGTVLSRPKIKVARALTKTFQEDDLTKNLRGAVDATEDLSFRADVSVTMMGQEISGTYSQKAGSDAGQSLKVSIPGDLIGMDSDLAVTETLDAEKVTVDIPDLLSSPLAYPYTYRTSGGLLEQYAGEEYLDAVDVLLRYAYDCLRNGESDRKEAKKAIMKQLKELPMEKVGTEELTVRGKDVSCAGYRITVDDQFLRDLTEAAAVRPTDDVQQAIRTLTGQDPEDLIGSYSDIYMDPMSSSFTADITFYVGKGRVAAVECVTGGENYRLEFRGEDIPWYDTRLLVSGTDTGVRMLVTDSGDSENVRIEADGEAIDLVYGKTAHDYEVRYAGVSMARGTLESRGDDFTFTMEPSGAKELIGDLSVRFDLYDDASLDQISGTPLDISQASEEDIYSLMEGIDDLGYLF